ncbi:kelch-like protein 40 [Neocloeon triangulifer]|uniref:kelch-like protein 40 n=1 Tax=Neocloeon triangulifer TaxID=2078957 RepID=UPI00286F374A|nr:kelch-like protein 40 [Neocloeon triangulifer]
MSSGFKEIRLGKDKGGELEQQLQVASRQAKKLLTWLESGEHYDCTFQAGPSGSSKEGLFKCHQLVLATSSPVLARMLYAHFNEDGKGVNDPIFLPDVDVLTFKAALRFIYGRETVDLPDESMEQAISILEFASKWQILGLDQLAAAVCLHYDHSAEDLLLLHHLFCTNGLTDEPKKIMQLICERGSEVLKMLSAAHKDTVLEILRQDQLNFVCEKDLYDALIEWGSAKITDSDKNPVLIRSQVKTLLPLIRFKTFSVKDFAQLCKEPPVVTDEEKLKMFSILHQKTNDCIRGFDLESPWRGMFDPATLQLTSFKAECSLQTIESQEKQFTFSSIEFKSPTYLLGVAIYSLCHLNEGAEMHLKLEITCSGNRYPMASVEHHVASNMFSHKDLANSLVMLKNPCLLQPFIMFCVKVTHFAGGMRKHARFSMGMKNDPIPSDQDTPVYRCRGGEVVALKVAKPMKR